jgi:hypothetical protein
MRTHGAPLRLLNALPARFSVPSVRNLASLLRPREASPICQGPLTVWPSGPTIVRKSRNPRVALPAAVA